MGVIMESDIESFNSLRESLLKNRPSQFPALLNAINSYLGASSFSTLKDFVSAPVGQGGLGLKMEQVEHLLWFNPSYKHKAKKLSVMLGLAERAKQVPTLNEHGAVGNGRGDNSKNITSTVDRGTSADYRIAKLKRDNPDVALRLEQGEFKNVAEAERVAGVKPPKREGKRLHMYKDDPLTAIDALIEYYGIDAINEVISKLTGDKK